jgi:hypothetical protein
MEDKTFEELVKRLKKVNDVIKDLDPAIQTQAFELLSPYVLGGELPPADKPGGEGAGSGGGGGGAAATGGKLRERLLRDHGQGKPADNALLTAGIWFSDYGSNRFSIPDLKTIGDNLGVTLPDDMGATIRQLSRDGKRLFRSPARGHYEPTVHGATYFKTTFKVTQGKRTPPSSDT